MPFRSMLLCGAVAVLIPAAAFAQDAAAPPAEDAQSGEKAPHVAEGQEIIVTGSRPHGEDVLAGASVVSGAELTVDLRPTIGETLARQPGVSATSFGPNASRPVLRGFQGDRVRVLTDGIGSLDVSSTSVDHAVAINPLTAERIEVLRGPAALLYGPEAIGGVVNVIDTRIPRRVPDEPVHVDGIVTYGSAANERSINAAVDVPVGRHFVVHADGNYSKTDDLEIGGYVLAPELRAEAAASPDPAIRALADLKGTLPNTAARTSDIAAGAAYVDGDTDIGFSINHYDSLYGVPIRYSLDPNVESEAPRIDINQTRADARAEIDTGSGFIDSVRLRGGYSDYRHDELEQDGAIGTTFFSKGAEGRLEFVQSRQGGWDGSFGAQYLHRTLNVVGDEKFLPRNDTDQIGLFALESLDRGAFKGEVAGRYDHADLSAEADADLGNPALDRSFDAVSGAIGASYAIAHGLRLGLNASHTERIPSEEELFANGPHAGTQAFEIGDPNLSNERSWGLEATLKASGDGYSLDASVFQSWFDTYIFDRRTGEVRDGLPVFQTDQAGARYFGFELDGSVRLADLGDYTLNLDGVADYIRATIDTAGPAPRIPPLRLLGGIEAQSDRLQGRLEAEWVNRQDRVAPLETPTDGFTLVNASVAFKPFPSNRDTTITLSANNIFDVDARRHASFLKDYAPLAGRDIRISARVSF